jgi:hypothetical protein
VRIALGASRPRVLGQVIGQGLTLVAIGLALGAAASTALTRACSAYLFDTAPTDPATFAASAFRSLLRLRSRAWVPRGARRRSIRCRRCARTRPLARVVDIVVPRRRLRAGDDAGDVRIFALRGGRLRRLSILRLLASRRFGLLLFLAGAFACAFVLSWT